MDKADVHPQAARPRPTVRIGRRSLVVLAGLPGAGKTTMLGKLRDIPGITALDSEDARVVLRRILPAWLPYRYYRPLVHLVHRSRIAWYCLFRRGPIIAHEPATRGTTRAMLWLFGRFTRRRLVLLWLHADPDTALAGQQARGRLIRSGSFRKHVRRALRMHQRLCDGERPRGWERVCLLTREQVEDGIRLEVVA